MKIKVLALVAFFAVGCSANTAYKGAQVATGLGGELAGDLVKNTLGTAFKPTPDITERYNVREGREIGQYRVGNYDVKMFEGFQNNSYTHIVFTLKWVNARRIYIKRLAFDKKKEIKEIDNFNQLDEAGKKQLIREWYHQYHKIDLNPDPA